MARGIADGIALWAGGAPSTGGTRTGSPDVTPSRGPVPDPVRREAQAPVPDETRDGVSTQRGGAGPRGNDGNSQSQVRKRGQQTSQKKSAAKLLVVALGCVAVALVVVVCVGRVGSSSAKTVIVQASTSEDIAKAEADSPKENVAAGEDESGVDEVIPADEAAEDEARSGVVADPRVVEDSSMEAGQRTTWDCVWLGTYPQSFVTDAATEAALDDASGWSESGDLAYEGETYRRLKEAKVTHSGMSFSYWDWGQASTVGYCYFRWEPVKWRVLEADGSTALLLADVALDGQHYNDNWADVTWETCGLRVWLKQTFWCDALTSSQQEAVVSQDLVNADNTYYGTTSGNATTDQVFLLSESDVWSTDEAARHGFVKLYGTHDKARRCKVSGYAHARGVYDDSGGSYDGYCWWWLRSPGNGANYASNVDNDGNVNRFGLNVNYDNDAVRPALRISLSSDQVSYAGTVCSDGTVDAVAPSASKK